MQISIEITGHRAEGKTRLMNKIKDLIDQSPLYKIQYQRGSLTSEPTESLVLELKVNNDAEETKTPETHINTLIEQAAQASKDNEGTASMKLAQAALSISNVMMNLRALQK